MNESDLGIILKELDEMEPCIERGESNHPIHAPDIEMKCEFACCRAS